MKFSFTDQKDNLSKYLTEFKKKSFSFDFLENFPENKKQIIVASPISDLQHYDFHFLFRYKIFPEDILDFYGEWEKENRNMQVGDVIVQQGKVPPGKINLKFIFGVRILSIFHEKHRVGFSYGTLEGHPETGVNEFSFYISGNTLFAQIHTKAKPASLLSRSLGPIFTDPYVRYCNRRGLQMMKEQFLMNRGG